VTDTGEGMSEQVLSRIFEPFFTTKATGKGTGLGLATVYAIVEQSGGTIWVSSTVGVGTMFTIYLPRVDEVAPAALAEPELRPARAGETILIVEDDAPVRELAVRILRAAGYATLSAGEGVEALQIIAVHPDPIDLIVTDVVLTGMGGRDLASHASAIAPGIPVLFTSGHTDDLVLAHGVRENMVHFIGKPYTTAALSNKVREVLNATRKERSRERRRPGSH
jgi:two-component system cell cycle sensor histidine kinase/response regulator CckA